jgi:hypothetical protein
MEWTKEDFQVWLNEPITKRVMQYLNDFNVKLVAIHKEHFISGIRLSEQDFYRESERYTTIEDVVNLTYEDIEEFYSND